MVVVGISGSCRVKIDGPNVCCKSKPVDGKQTIVHSKNLSILDNKVAYVELFVE